MLACDDDLSIRGHDDRVCDRRAGGEARHYAARLAERWVDLPRPHARKREARAAICLQRPGRHDGRAVAERETNSPDSAAPFAGEAGGEAIQDNGAVLQSLDRAGSRSPANGRVSRLRRRRGTRQLRERPLPPGSRHPRTVAAGVRAGVPLRSAPRAPGRGFRPHPGRFSVGAALRPSSPSPHRLKLL